MTKKNIVHHLAYIKPLYYSAIWIFYYIKTINFKKNNIAVIAGPVFSIPKVLGERIALVLPLARNALQPSGDERLFLMRKYVSIQESLANAKVSARQSRYYSLNWPPLRIAEQYQRNLYIVEKYFQCATIPLRVYLHSFSRCCLPNMQPSARFRKNLFELIAVQGHPKSMILVPIESAYATSY